MNLTYFDTESGVVKECSIAEAIEAEIDANSEGNGIIENLTENQTAGAGLVGRLVQHLCEKGLIEDNFVLDVLLQNGYERSEE